MNFTWLDYVIIGIFLLNGLLGLSRGLLREIISMIALIFAFVIAIQFTLPITGILNSSDGFKSLVAAFSSVGVTAIGPISYFSLGLSFTLLFVATYTTGEAVNYYSPIGALIFPIFFFIDHLIAGVLGFIRGFAFNVVMILILGLSPITQQPAWTQSYFVPILKPYADWLGKLTRPGGFPTWSNGPVALL